MAKENVKALCLRFDLADEDELRAYNHLQNRDKAEFGSYTKLVSRAVNEFLNDGQSSETIRILRREKKKMLLLRGCLMRYGIRHLLCLQVKKQRRRNKRRTWRQCSLFLTISDDSKSSAFAITKLKNTFMYAIKNKEFYITEEFTEC